jgi:hypothetical protein
VIDELINGCFLSADYKEGREAFMENLYLISRGLLAKPRDQAGTGPRCRLLALSQLVIFFEGRLDGALDL